MIDLSSTSTEDPPATSPPPSSAGSPILTELLARVHHLLRDVEADGNEPICVVMGIADYNELAHAMVPASGWTSAQIFGVRVQVLAGLDPGEVFVSERECFHSVYLPPGALSFSEGFGISQGEY